MKELLRRGLAVTLTLLLVISALTLPVAAGPTDEVVNYPALRGYAGGLPENSEVWDYYLADYAKTAALAISDASFAAPVADFDANDSVTTLSWNPRAGATSYTLTVYEDGEAVETLPRLTATHAILKTLPGGGNYAAQVTAFAGETALSASQVGQFRTEDDAEQNRAVALTAEASAPQKADVLTDDGLVSVAADAQAGFRLSNVSGDRRVVFRAAAGAAQNYGGRLIFTAPEAGLYDFTNEFAVTGNKTATGSVYVRVGRQDASGALTVLSPYDGTEWYTAAVTASDRNPFVGMYAPQAQLAAGEQVVLEVYAELTAGTTLEISLGNPTATPVSAERTYKGTTETYPFKNYTPLFLYDDPDFPNSYAGNNPLPVMYGRWYETCMLVSPDGITYANPQFVDRYKIRGCSSFRTSKGVGKCGYYFYYAEDKRPMRLMASNATAGEGLGTALHFTVPRDGRATLSAVMQSVSNREYFFRVLHNDTVISPQNGGWTRVQAANKVDYPVNLSVEVSQGDLLTLELYTESEGNLNFDIPTPPSVVMTDTRAANAADSDSFSPLWERPYQGVEYDGAFAELDSAVFRFDQIDASKPASPVVSDSDHYSSATRYLTADAAPQTGYFFDPEQLRFRFGSDTQGMSLSFTAPARGYFDFSTQLALLEGEATVYARLLKGDQTVWPTEGDWQSFDAAQPFPALELGLAAGESLTLQAYAVRAEGSETAPVLGLGTPIVQPLSNRVFTDSGNVTVYRPTDYAAFETGYSGAYLPLDSRFTYAFGDAAPDNSDAAAQTLSNASGKVSFADGKLALTLEAGATGAVTLHSPMAGAGSWELAGTGDVEIRLLQNGTVLRDWGALPGEAVPLDGVQAGDDLTCEIRASGAAQVAFDTFAISLIGQHNNANLPTDDGFYALYANPYGDDYYVGPYRDTGVSSWRFDFYESDDDRIRAADYYDADRKALSDQARGDAYLFGATNLTAELSAAQHGIALGFTAPRDDRFNLRSGLRVSAAATVRARVIQIDGETDDVTQLWPTEGFATETLAANADLAVPYLAADMKQGDRLYLEITADAPVSINLVSPAVLREETVEYVNADISGQLYWAQAFPAYFATGYNGSYIPMENRWNFEFFRADASLTPLETVQATTYLNTGSVTEVIAKPSGGSVGWVRHQIGKTNYNVHEMPILASNGELYGNQLRFLAPGDCDVVLSGIPSFSSVSLPANPHGDYSSCAAAFRILQVDGQTGEQTTVWPQDVETPVEGWEILTTEKPVSQVGNRSVHMNPGDEILYQFSLSLSETDYETAKSAGEGLGIGLDFLPCVALVESITTGRRNFSHSAEYSRDIQLNPYWSYEYSLDSENLFWQRCTRTAWNYWCSNPQTYLGAGESRLWIQNRNGSLDGMNLPVTAYRFTPETDGYCLMSSASQIYIYSGAQTITPRIRITVNDETVWPEHGWQTVEPGEKLQLKDVIFEIKQGDAVRFEMSTVEPVPTGEQIYLQWNPTFNFSRYRNMYTATSDIYNLLDETMLAHFKAMEPSGGFDPDPAASKALSDSIAARKEANAQAGSTTPTVPDSPEPPAEDTAWNPFEPDTYLPGTPGTEGIPGDYSEWTEEQFIPGGRYKTVIRHVTVLWWVYLLIALGVLAVAAAVVLLILYKKGKLSKKTN